jgi:hypothetical protein
VTVEEIRKVFISYAHKDQDFAETVKRKLESLGVDVFIDLNDIKWGQPLTETILNGLSNCHAVVTIVPADPDASCWWVPLETGYALGKGKKLLPIKRDRHVKMPDFFQAMVYAEGLEEIDDYFSDHVVKEHRMLRALYDEDPQGRTMRYYRRRSSFYESAIESLRKKGSIVQIKEHGENKLRLSPYGRQKAEEHLWDLLHSMQDKISREIPTIPSDDSLLQEAKNVRILRELLGEESGRNLYAYLKNDYYRPALVTLERNGCIYPNGAYRLTDVGKRMMMAYLEARLPSATS